MHIITLVNYTLKGDLDRVGENRKHRYGIKVYFWHIFPHYQGI